MDMEKFLEVYGTLPRAGPGSNELTKKAFGMLGSLPPAPRILDVGCGPGMQTLELLRLSRGSVVALDLMPRMIERLEAGARAAGVADRLTTRVQDMGAMDFPPESFDLVWSEGAIYLLGFAAGLERFAALVRPGGSIAVSEAVWLKPDPPPEAIALWAEYPEIDSVDAKLAVVADLGLELLGHFVFPPAAWTEHYYDPLEARIAEKARAWAADPDGQAILAEARHEISVFRSCHAYYGYAFFVMRKPDAA